MTFTFHQLFVLLGWEAAALSEGQACRLLGVDIVSAREMREEALAVAAKLWDEHRVMEYLKKEGKA